ncbi:hypothetical protein TVAG_475740 [Trichomonas vaginalis G3]|uniref:IgGFc-binding protein N-terminal domain-containing protein n=1 Tax=Trichomonas vaginalis (strain ATCC PRA-98 / G3) TaxID=412133 RepID=A2D9Z8_TRIV3|nr:hypothetical protein TVAGG3_0265710 [Trichomonas vaginalis G3]EAY22646.1 hypothetical protein TVAG_475740 [Trichomonas vaginalis G3]KAI5525460.1 hypothetical protein TVAGG3_0265710 [Trichomonas vaginalis G3]|eukprot:XP_001583632.1 hypothetical protein [Trichomonas vaginalis G3]
MLLLLYNLVSSLQIGYGITNGYHEMTLDQGETLNISECYKVTVINYKDLGLKDYLSEGLIFTNTFNKKVVVKMMIYAICWKWTEDYDYYHTFSKPTNLYLANSDQRRIKVDFDFQHEMITNEAGNSDIYLPEVSHFYFKPSDDLFTEVDTLPDSFRLYFSGTYLITVGTSPKTISVSNRAIIIIIRNDVQTNYQKIITGVESISFPAGSSADSCVQLIYADFGEELAGYSYDIIHNPKNLEVGYKDFSHINLIIYSDSSMFVSIEDVCKGEKKEWLLQKNEALMYHLYDLYPFKLRADSLDQSLTSELLDIQKDKYISSLQNDNSLPYDVCISAGHTLFCNVSTKETFLCSRMISSVWNPSLYNFDRYTSIITSKSRTNELVTPSLDYGDHHIINEFGTFKNKDYPSRNPDNGYIMAVSTIPIKCTDKEKDLEIEKK